ncbi:hypothetical protein Zm00014a_037434 [Zea mays]|uniref:Uncharacterized protein n=1 Tax=Zea mays TaxID=4577 RepID=A0A3L6DIK7_MAIZE|nr:hypothetical protein Zm00014a_037434 [Zea mays]
MSGHYSVQYKSVIHDYLYDLLSRISGKM